MSSTTCRLNFRQVFEVSVWITVCNISNPTMKTWWSLRRSCEQNKAIWLANLSWITNEFEIYLSITWPQYLSRVRVRPLARSEYSRVCASQSEYSFWLATREYSHFISLASTRYSQLASACESKGSDNLYKYEENNSAKWDKTPYLYET
jgi:hypothetical protein